MSQPFEQKYRQVKMNLTAKKIEADTLRRELRNLQQIHWSTEHQLIMAHGALFQVGCRRLDDMTWTNEPFKGGE